MTSAYAKWVADQKAIQDAKDAFVRRHAPAIGVVEARRIANAVHEQLEARDRAERDDGAMLSALLELTNAKRRQA